MQWLQNKQDNQVRGFPSVAGVNRRARIRVFPGRTAVVGVHLALPDARPGESSGDYFERNPDRSREPAYRSYGHCRTFSQTNRKDETGPVEPG